MLGESALTLVNDLEDVMTESRVRGKQQGLIRLGPVFNG